MEEREESVGEKVIPSEERQNGRDLPSPIYGGKWAHRQTDEGNASEANPLPYPSPACGRGQEKAENDPPVIPSERSESSVSLGSLDFARDDNRNARDDNVEEGGQEKAENDSLVIPSERSESSVSLRSLDYARDDNGNARDDNGGGHGDERVDNKGKQGQASAENYAVATQNKPNKIGELFRNYFTATRMAYLAVFTALAYVLYMPFLEFPIIPAVPFLKVDFSNSFVMIAGFALGPVAGVVVGVLKELLHALTFSQTVGVGELANILIMLPYVLVPSIIYKKRKGIKTVLVSLAIGSVCQVIWSIPTNYLLTFPFFLMAYAGAPDWATGMDFYLTVWYWAVLFNFVKTALITAAVLILYKPLSKLIKVTNAKFSAMKKRSV